MDALWLAAATLFLSMLTLVLVVLLWRRRPLDETALHQQMQQALIDNAQQQAVLQEQQFRHNRQELADALQRFSVQLGQQQQLLVSSTATQLEHLKKQIDDSARSNREELTRSLETVRLTVETQLRQLQDDNGKKLEQMRQTVDEKLHQTLETRLGQSFRLVSERLEQVQKGLGEMQQLANGVGDLKRVLSNVKTRGVLGEYQLANLLEQMLTPAQYAANVATRPGRNERVEFAIRMPGREEGRTVWLPVDAKFPIDAYQQLQATLDTATEAAVIQDAQKIFARTIETFAKTIADKYLEPPHTTDFAVLFLPFESLYAEVLRIPGLFERLQRNHRVVVAGPTTTAALLNSLQMGFRTLAIEKRSSEVWELLGAVKTEFGKFGVVLEKTQKKLDEASREIGQAGVRTRAIERKLRSVEQLPEREAVALLGPVSETDAGEADDEPT